MTEEIWKDIEGYEGTYQVSNMGRVRSLDKEVLYIDGRRHVYKGKILKLSYRKGYAKVRLYNNDKGKNFQVHRLVAQAFVPNPENKPEIDHINTIRNDNRSINLKWTTHEENMNNSLTKEHITKGNTGRIHSKETKRKIGEGNKGKHISQEQKQKLRECHLGKKLSQETILKLGKKVICIETGVVYNSITEASNAIGVAKSSLHSCLSGRSKTCKGYHWAYYKEEVV